MGVYINGMEMPMVCGACTFCLKVVSDDDEAYCMAGGPCARLNIDTRHPQCPLIPVPDHGDLIDRDAIKTGLWGEDEYRMLCDAPVVIPAERREE